MAYESRHLRRYKCRYNSTNDDNPLTYQLVKDGDKITPASAAITIYRPGSTTALVTAGAMTVSGTLCTYCPTTTTVASWPVGTGYRAHIVATTAGAVTYDDEVMFDVAKIVPFGRVTKDQLVALDGRVQGRTHNGDEDFSEIIEAARDDFQFDLETQAITDGQLLETMILDQSRAHVVARKLILSKIFRESKELDEAESYFKEYRTMLRQLLSGVKYDANQDLEEDTTQGGRVAVKLQF